MKKGNVTTTGELRELLAQATTDVLSGVLEIDKAMAIHRLAKNISESLYSETKIAIFTHQTGKPVFEMGDLPLGSIADKREPSP